MRKLFDDLRAQLEGFVDQRQHAALIVPAGTREYVALCAALNGLDQGGSRHVFLIFGDKFEEPVQYVSALVTALQARMSELALATKRPTPAIPARVLDTGLEPVPRLQALLTVARSLIPARSDLRLVAALLPESIRDDRAHARFVDELLEHDLTLPWCRNMRFVVRENRTDAERSLRKHARYYDPDLSDDALIRALESECNDDTLSIAERMRSLMVLAGMDSSQQRTAQALEKYELLARYHGGMGELPALALAVNGMGEACALSKRSQEAREHFERALTPAIESEDLPTLSSITYNLARLHQGSGEWETAREYYAGLSLLARAALNAVLLVICHEQQGECSSKLGAHEQAIEHWRAGLTLAGGMGLLDQQLGISMRLRELFSARGRTAELRELEREISSLRQAGAQEAQRW